MASSSPPGPDSSGSSTLGYEQILPPESASRCQDAPVRYEQCALASGRSAPAVVRADEMDNASYVYDDINGYAASNSYEPIYDQLHGGRIAADSCGRSGAHADADAPHAQARCDDQLSGQFRLFFSSLLCSSLLLVFIWFGLVWLGFTCTCTCT